MKYLLDKLFVNIAQLWQLLLCCAIVKNFPTESEDSLKTAVPTECLLYSLDPDAQCFNMIGVWLRRHDRQIVFYQLEADSDPFDMHDRA